MNTDYATAGESSGGESEAKGLKKWWGEFKSRDKAPTPLPPPGSYGQRQKEASGSSAGGAGE
jgi:hypothetical protein